MSKSILAKLYDGKIYPCEQIQMKSQECADIEKMIDEEKQYFKSVLSETDRKRFEELEEAFYKLLSMECYEHYEYGFKLATKLVFAGLAEYDDKVKTDE